MYLKLTGAAERITHDASNYTHNTICLSIKKVITSVHERAIASLHEKLIASVSEKAIASPHEKVIASAHEKAIASAHKSWLLILSVAIINLPPGSTVLITSTSIASMTIIDPPQDQQRWSPFHIQRWSMLNTEMIHKEVHCGYIMMYYG